MDEVVWCVKATAKLLLASKVKVKVRLTVAMPSNMMKIICAWCEREKLQKLCQS